MAKTTFIDGNKSQGIMGTRVMAAFLNKIFNHRHTGLDDDGHAPLDYAVDSGTANSYVISLSPVLDALVSGLPIYFKATNTNTGASTLQIGSLTAKEIRMNGSALVAGQILAGQIYSVQYDGTYFQIMSIPGNMITWNNLTSTPTANQGAKYNGSGILKGAELNMTGEVSSRSTSGSTSASLGSVTSGDRIVVYSIASGVVSQLNEYVLMVEKTSSSTATIIFGHNSQTQFIQRGYMPSGNNIDVTVSGIIKVTGSGTLSLKAALNGIDTLSYVDLYAAFLRKT